MLQWIAVRGVDDAAPVPMAMRAGRGNTRALIPGCAMGHLLIAIALNAIPLIGVWKFGWAGGTVLLLYWLESLLGHLATMVKIKRHAALTHKRGHHQYIAVDARGAAGSYFSYFSSIALMFTIAHGLFLGVILAMLAHNKPEWVQFNVSWDNVKYGAILVAVLVSVDLAIDLRGIGKRSFLWIETVAGKRLTRVLVMHLTLIFGFAAMAMIESPIALLLVFIALKTMLDVAGSMVPDDGLIDVGYPEQPPRFLRWIERVKPATGGKETLAEFWARGRKETLARRKRHEEVMSSGRIDRKPRRKAE